MEGLLWLDGMNWLLVHVWTRSRRRVSCLRTSLGGEREDIAGGWVGRGPRRKRRDLAVGRCSMVLASVYGSPVIPCLVSTVEAVVLVVLEPCVGFFFLPRLLPG